MKHKIIFIALDCSISKAKSIIKSIPKINSKKYKFALKIGYQIFFAKGGREFIKSIKNYTSQNIGLVKVSKKIFMTTEN